jgi:hypothetical protein
MSRTAVAFDLDGNPTFLEPDALTWHELADEGKVFLFRDRRCPGKDFQFSHAGLDPKGRWFVCGHVGLDRLGSFILGLNPRDYLQFTPEEVAAFFHLARRDLPPDLADVVRRHAMVSATMTATESTDTAAASGTAAPGPAAPEDVGESSQTPTTTTATPTPKSEGEAPKPSKPVKEPSARAFAAYRAVRIAGMKQTEVAPRLGVDQSTVSRWVDAVGEWVKAGNVLPDDLAALPPRPKITAMDPRMLEQGPRRRGRV